MISLKDVAREAGVSAMTVSRHINKSGYVGKEAAMRIDQAISALDYQPNALARSMVTKKTNTIGLVIASITNPFYPELVLGVQDAAYARNASVMLCSVEGKASVEHFSRLLMEKRVDGIVFAHLDLNEAHVRWLIKHEIACALIDNQTPCALARNVRTDDEAGMGEATRHLLGLGHKDIGLIRGPLGRDDQNSEEASCARGTPYEETFQFAIWRDRTRGFLRAMREAGLSVPQSRVVRASGSPTRAVDSGERAAQALLALQDRPTALLCENDLLAIGAYRALAAAGLRVPDDISVMGYDGLLMSEYLCPKLTTMVQPKYEMGRAAAAQLLDMGAASSARLSATLRIGGSTGVCPQGAAATPSA